jgi:hypothetical protein
MLNTLQVWFKYGRQSVLMLRVRVVCYGVELEAYCLYRTAAESHPLGGLCSAGILRTACSYFLPPIFRHGLSASSLSVKKFF